MRQVWNSAAGGLQTLRGWDQRGFFKHHPPRLPPRLPPGSDEPNGPMSHTLPPGSPAGNCKSHTLTSCDFEAATSPAWICHSGLNSSRMFWKQSLFFAFPSCFVKCRKHSIKTCIVTQTPLAKQVTGGGGGQRLLATDLRTNPDHQEGGLRSLITILSLGFLV